MMKKNKLYTANRWNQPAFMQEKNLFSGLFGSSQMNQPFKFTGFTPEAQAAVDKNTVASLPKAGGLLGNIGDKIGGVMGGGSLAGSPIGGIIGGLGTAVGGLANNLISGGLSSGAGSAVSSIGGTVGSMVSNVNPVLGGIISAGSGIIGGGINALFGESVDEEALKAANAGTDAYNNFTSNAGSFDDITGPEAQANVKDVYRGGLFNDVSDKNEALKQERRDARSWAFRSVDNNINNLVNDQMNDALANYSAFGGPLDQYNNDNMSAVNHGFMSDHLTMKKKQAEQKNNTSNLFVGMPSRLFDDGGYMTEQEAEKAAADSFHNNVIWNSNLPFGLKGYSTLGKETFNNMLGNIQQSATAYAFGGDLQTNGGDFSTGLVSIGAGKSHEENPNEGVQLGVDSEGIPNLVEENETVWNDYVFSARIPIDQTTKEMFHIGKKREMTYADLSKKLEKEIAETPNDPISKAGFEKQMQMLEEQQERQKQEMEAERAKAAFEALSPEEQTALMQQRAEQEAMAQQAMAEQQAAMQQPTPEELAIAQQQQMADGSEAVLGQEPQVAANGGKLFKGGGDTKKNAGTWKKGTSKENWDKYSRNGLRDFLMKVNDDLANADTEEEKNKTRENAIKTVRGIQQAYSEAYQNNLTPSEVNEKVTALQKAFQEAGGNAYFGDIADNINLPKGHNTADTEEKGWIDGLWGPRTSIRNWGSTEYGDDYDDIRELAASAGLTYAPGQYKYGDNTLYELGMAQPDVTAMPEGEVSEAAWDYGDPNMSRDSDGTPVVTGNDTVPGDASVKKAETSPRHKWGWLRYAGLLGPAVGLGMQALGIGRPDTGAIDAALQGAGDVNTAKWKPLGNYLTYRPLDIWFAQNRMDANSRATDRNLMNISGGNRGTAMAGLLANGYANQIANGNLFRQAQEYNDNLRKQVEEFNRSTDRFNSEQYGVTSRFNADARNRARQANAQMRLHAAAQKADMDAGWNQGIYGNVAGLFKGIGDIGRENEQFNWLSDLAADGVFGNLGTSNTSRRWTKEKKAKGGKMRKKGLTI